MTINSLKRFAFRADGRPTSVGISKPKPLTSLVPGLFFKLKQPPNVLFTVQDADHAQRVVFHLEVQTDSFEALN